MSPAVPFEPRPAGAAPTPILFTIPNFVTAGSGRAMLKIIERLDRHRFTPAICVRREGGDLEREILRQGIPLLKAPFTISSRPYATFLPRLLTAARTFRPYGFALWHSFHYSDDYTEPLIARLSGARGWVYTKKNMLWNNRAWRLRTRFASRIVAQNQEMQDLFFPNIPDRTRLIPRGVDTDQFKPGPPDLEFRRSWNLAECAVVIGHVANLLPVKNHAHLIRALAHARPEVALVIAGSVLDVEYTKSLERLVSELHLEKRVRFLGAVQDTPRLLRSVDAFAFCSQMESCPVAVLEAMACQAPSVVTDIPAMRAIHVADETALVVPAANVELFARALDQLAGDAGLRRDIGERARIRILDRFSIEREVREHEALYQEVLGITSTASSDSAPWRATDRAA